MRLYNFEFLSFGEAALSRIAEGHMLLLRLALRYPTPPQCILPQIHTQGMKQKDDSKMDAMLLLLMAHPPKLSALKEILGFLRFSVTSSRIASNSSFEQ